MRKESRSGSQAVRTLALTRLVSVSGNGAATIAIGFKIYSETHSGLYLAATFVVLLGITGFLAPWAGGLADRFNRRTVMVTSELSGSVIFAAMAFVQSPKILITLAFAAACARVPFGPAMDASVPNLVDPLHLTWANSLLASANSVGSLIGPGLGGVLFALFGSPAAFGANAGSFLASGVLLLKVRGSFSVTDDDRTSEHVGPMAGFRFIRTDPYLIRLGVAWWAIVWLAVNVGFVADPALAQKFHVGSIGYSAIDVMFALGGLLGSVVARWPPVQFGDSQPAIAATGLAIASGIVAVSPAFAILLLAVLLGAVFSVMGDIAADSAVQRRTPDEVRGRVFAIFTAMGLIGSVFGYVAAGVMLDAWGPEAIYAFGAASALVAACTMRSLSKIGERGIG